MFCFWMITPVKLRMLYCKCTCKTITCTNSVNNFKIFQNFLIWWCRTFNVKILWNKRRSFTSLFKKNFKIGEFRNKFVSDLINDIIKIDSGIKTSQLSFIWWDIIEVLKKFLRNGIISSSTIKDDSFSFWFGIFCS